MRERIVAWLVFLILVQGVILLGLFIGWAIYRIWGG